MKKSWIVRLTAAVAVVMMLMAVLAACSAGSSNESMAIGDAPSMNEAAGGMDAGAADAVKPESGGAVGEAVSGEFDRKIIRTVNMSCEATAYDDAVTAIMTALAEHGGYVEASTVTNDQTAGKTAEQIGNARRASYTLRIPAEKLDAFLEALRTDGGIHVVSQDMSSDEITGAYYDTKTRLETLNAEKTSLSAMLEGFTDYGDISAMLQVQERLYNVIEEMEALQTKLNLYDSQVAMSTVNLSLREVVTFTEVEEPGFGERMGKAFAESWTDFGHGCQDFAVWFVESFPTLLIWAIVLTGIALIVIRIVKKRRKNM